MDPSCHQAVEPTNLVPFAVIAASFLGSGHCVAMCGGLVIAATRTTGGVFLYHAGRLIGYLLLGFSFGLIGEWVKWSPREGLSYFFAIFMGSSFIVLGVINWRDGKMHLPMPALIERWVVSFSGKFIKKSGESSFNLYPGIIGFCSIFLPCGWLYAFALGAMATQVAWQGAILMFAFWLGTLPALVVTPLLFQKVLAPLTKNVPKLSSIILIVIGIVTVLYRFLPK